MARGEPASPTLVRFYQLAAQPLESALARIAHKAWDRGWRCCVVAAGQEQARRLDDLLWVQPPGGFLPHRLWDAPEPERQPLLIALEPDDRNGATVLLMAAGRPPVAPERFDMVVEFADARDETALEASRQRFRRYRELGCRLEYWIQGPEGWVKKD